MGRRRSRTAIVERLRRERERLEATVAAVDTARMAQGGVVRRWSVKDVLAHLADWEEHMLAWVEAARRGEPVPGPEEGLGWNELKLFNERVYARHCDRSLDEVLRYFRSTHARFMALVATMPDDELLDRRRYSFLGSQAVYDWLVVYAEHDAWGTRRIGEWMATTTATPVSGQPA